MLNTFYGIKIIKDPNNRIKPTGLPLAPISLWWAALTAQGLWRCKEGGQKPCILKPPAPQGKQPSIVLNYFFSSVIRSTCWPLDIWSTLDNHLLFCSSGGLPEHRIYNSFQRVVSMPLNSKPEYPMNSVVYCSNVFCSSRIESRVFLLS